MKKCYKCGDTKEISEFYKDKYRKDGLTNSCKVCRAINMRKWQEANRERTRELSRVTYHRYAKEYALAKRAYRALFPNECKLANKRNYENHLIERRAAMREYAKQNHEKFLDYSSQRRARLKGATIERVNRMIVFVRDNGVCYLCDQPIDVGNFHLDHVIPLFLGGNHCYDNVAITHPACNLSKGKKLIAEGGE